MRKRISRRRDTDPSEGLERYGDTLFADPTNKKYPIDTPGRIKAAWAYNPEEFIELMARVRRGRRD
ncbi:MAG TPA: DUF6582 domain-containing protein [Gemmatimonadales bacterium]